MDYEADGVILNCGSLLPWQKTVYQPSSIDRAHISHAQVGFLDLWIFLKRLLAALEGHPSAL